MTYGCHNRKPIQTFGATTCQYTWSEIGAFDHKCGGCQEQRKAYRAPDFATELPNSPEYWTPAAVFDRHIASARAMDEHDKGNKWSDCA